MGSSRLLRAARPRVPLALVAVALAAAALSACAGTGAGTPPAPTPTATSYAQYDTLYADWAATYVTCVRSFGVDAKQGDSGTIKNALVPGRPTKQGLDAGCVDKVGPPPDVPPATPAFMKGLYELYLKQADFLRQHGYTISAPPSRDDWVENYSGTSWNPLMDVNNAGRDVQQADALCPQPQPRDAEKLGATL